MTEKVKAEINPGDKIEIDTPKGIIVGRVLTAHNYYDLKTGAPNWYIEVDSQYWGYMYWKQGIDGGSVYKCVPEQNNHLCEII